VSGQGNPAACYSEEAAVGAVLRGILRPEWPGNCPIIERVLLLSLDTSSPTGSVAVLRDENVLGLVSTCTGEDYSSRMFRHVEWLLKELSLDLRRFDAFAVSSGPGSFTGLRVGLAAVKGWAEVYDRPILAVSALEAIAAQAKARVGLLVPAFDARRGEVYFGFHRRPAVADGFAVPEPEGDARVASPAEFLSLVAAKAGEEELSIVTPTPDFFAEPLRAIHLTREPSRQLRIESVTSVLAPLIGQIGYHRARMGKLQTSLTLDANYVRRTDAELKWKGPVQKVPSEKS
jgi:tRNA threonylcarbamoyl adenosine modification protein YeaZ